MISIDQSKLFPGIPGFAKVWVYQAGHQLNDSEKQLVRNELTQFIGEWKAHGSDLKAAAELLLDRFIVLVVDEAQAEASGCSIDSSVRKIREIGAKIQTDLLERGNIACVVNNEVTLIPFRDMKDKFQKKEINEETLIFDNSVGDLSSLRQSWIVKLKDSPAWQLVN